MSKKLVLETGVTRVAFVQSTGRRTNGVYAGLKQGSYTICRVLVGQKFHYAEVATLKKARRVRRVRQFGKVIGTTVIGLEG
jgi:hypothetical protein